MMAGLFKNELTCTIQDGLSNVRFWHKADRTTNKNYPVSANVNETADAAQRAIRSRLTCAATIGRLVAEELGDGQSDEIPECYRPSRFSVLQG